MTDAWLKSIDLNPQSVVLARLHIGDEGEFIGLGSKGMSFDGHNYDELINKNPINIVGGVTIEPKSAMMQIAQAHLIVNNTADEFDNRFSDLLEDSTLGTGDDYGFEDRLIEIRLIAEDVTTWQDSLLLVAGVMGAPVDNGETVSIPFSSENDVVTPTLENYITDADAADPNLGLPEETAGLIIPSIFGDHLNGKGNDSKALDTASVHNNMVKCLYLGIDATENHRWRVSDSKMNQATVAGVQSDFWAFCPPLNRKVRMIGATVEQNNSDGCIISLPNDALAQYIDYWYPSAATVSSGGTGTINDPGNVADKDFDTFGEMRYDNGASNGDSAFIDMSFDFYNEDIEAVIDSAFPCWYGKLTASGDAGTGDVDVEMTNAGPGVDPVGTKPIGGSYPDLRLRESTFAGMTVTSNVRIRTQLNVNIAAGEASLETYMVYKEIIFSPAEVYAEVYFGGKGASIGIAHNARATAEGYTETHIDNDNEGALGENPSTAMEMFLRRNLEMTQVSNGEFDSDTIWDKDAGITITGGQARWSGVEVTADLTQEGILRKSHLTRISGEVSGHITGDLTPKAGSGGAGTTLSDNGQFSEEIITAGSEDLIFAGTDDFEGRLDFAVSSDLINADSFNIASQDAPLFKMAPAINEVTESKDFIGDFAHQSRSLVWMDGGQFKHQVIKDTYTDTGFLDLDWRNLDNENFGRTSPRWIYTAVEVRYGLGPDGKLNKTTGALADSRAQTRYKKKTARNTLTIDAPYINDMATALLLRAFLLAQWKQPHNLHPFKVNIDDVELKTGDIYRLNHAPLVRGKNIESSFTLLGQTIYPFWLIYDVIKSQYGAKYLAFQLHRLDGS